MFKLISGNTCYLINTTNSSTTNTTTTKMDIKFSTDMEKYVVEFIRNNRAMWNPKDEFYFDKAKKNQLFKELAEQISIEFGKKVTVEALKRKWKHMRTSFTREFKKTTDRNVNNTGKPFRSRWVHFQSMMFLKDEETPDEITASLQKQEKIDSVSSLLELESLETNQELTVPMEESSPKEELEIVKTQPPPTIIEVKRTRDHIDAFLEHVNMSLRKFSDIQIQQYILKMQSELVNLFAEYE